MKRFLLLLLTLTFLSNSGCKKKGSPKAEDPVYIDFAAYKGTAKESHSNGFVSQGITIELISPHRYTTLNGQSSSGTFTIDKETITFAAESSSAKFGAVEILNGDYSYTYDGQHLHLWANRTEFDRYEYILEKK
jgi:hypothetical protein